MGEGEADLGVGWKGTTKEVKGKKVGVFRISTSDDEEPFYILS